MTFILFPYPNIHTIESTYTRQQLKALSTGIGLGKKISASTSDWSSQRIIFVMDKASTKEFLSVAFFSLEFFTSYLKYKCHN